MMCSKFLSWPARKGAVLTREETRGESDVLHPTLASDVPVEVSGHIARGAVSQGCWVNDPETVLPEHAQKHHSSNAWRAEVDSPC